APFSNSSDRNTFAATRNDRFSDIHLRRGCLVPGAPAWWRPRGPPRGLRGLGSGVGCRLIFILGRSLPVDQGGRRAVRPSAGTVKNMNRSSLMLLLCGTLLVAGPGCLARQFTRDGVSTQEAMADYYTEQAMANLILAKNNLPFVQLKYYGL